MSPVCYLFGQKTSGEGGKCRENYLIDPPNLFRPFPTLFIVYLRELYTVCPFSENNSFNCVMSLPESELKLAMRHCILKMTTQGNVSYLLLSVIAQWGMKSKKIALFSRQCRRFFFIQFLFLFSSLTLCPTLSLCFSQTPEELEDDSDFEQEDYDTRSRTSVQTEDDQLIAGQSARVSTCSLPHCVATSGMCLSCGT